MYAFTTGTSCADLSKHTCCLSLFGLKQKRNSETSLRGLHTVSNCRCRGALGMIKCARGDPIKHISILDEYNEAQMRCAHYGLSDIGILCSKYIRRSYLVCWRRLPMAEKERHYLECQSILLCKQRRLHQFVLLL